MKDITHVQVSIVNATEGHRVYDGMEEATPGMTPGECYFHAVKEYGRCTGHVYVDTKAGDVLKVGWVFLKRVKYDDCDETYLQETWVCPVHREPAQTHSIQVA